MAYNVFVLNGFVVDSSGLCTSQAGFIGSFDVATGKTATISDLTISVGGSAAFATDTIIADQLPTSDPLTSGALWNNSGSVNVSA